MKDSNYLRDRLRAAGVEQASTCTLCAAIVNRRFQEAHQHDGQADFEPFMMDTADAVDTCTLCGTIINPSYQEAHNRVVHLAGSAPLRAEPASVGVETCKLCGAIVNQSYQEAHDRTHT